MGAARVWTDPRRLPPPPLEPRPGALPSSRACRRRSICPATSSAGSRGCSIKPRRPASSTRRAVPRSNGAKRPPPAGGTWNPCPRRPWCRPPAPGAPPCATFDAEPAFAVGDAVRARNLHPAGHTRLPGYVRGKTGKVIGQRGRPRLPGLPTRRSRARTPRHLYAVRFSSTALWGDAAPSGDSVILDLFEPYLEGGRVSPGRIARRAVRRGGSPRRAEPSTNLGRRKPSPWPSKCTPRAYSRGPSGPKRSAPRSASSLRPGRRTISSAG